MRTVLAVLLLGGVAHADSGQTRNFLAGPVLGVAFGHHETSLVLGVEGGVGIGPERLNLGAVNRDRHGFVYLELDPWYIVGGSLGLGVDTDSGEVSGLVGVWEGVPVRGLDCNGLGYRFAATLSVGVRYTGVVELYVAPKVGVAETFCVD
jgi:hypothetical protein